MTANIDEVIAVGMAEEARLKRIAAREARTASGVRLVTNNAETDADMTEKYV